MVFVTIRTFDSIISFLSGTIVGDYSWMAPGAIQIACSIEVSWVAKPLRAGILWNIFVSMWSIKLNYRVHEKVDFIDTIVQ